jgi:hypothetical protein
VPMNITVLWDVAPCGLVDTYGVGVLDKTADSIFEVEECSFVDTY